MENQHRTQRIPKDANRVIVLSISLEEADHAAVRRILCGSHWRLCQADSLESAQPILDKQAVSVVLCNRDLRRGRWAHVLERFRGLPHPPCLIVTSSHPDERLWAEALNLGARDVLATPFNARELVWSVHTAWEQWRRRMEMAVTPAKVMTAMAS